VSAAHNDEIVGTPEVIKGDARDLPLADNSVDLIVTSPPYFRQRTYEDGGPPLADQIGQEPTPAEFVDALVAATRESLRVLRPTGSLWVNLGEKYVNRSLSGTPWRYALRCTDELGLALRAEVVWSKPNQFIDAKAADRVRRTHETWLHFTRPGKYDAEIDSIRVTPEADYKDRPQYRRAQELFEAAGLTEAHRAAIRSVGVIDSDGGQVRSGGRWTSDAGRLASEARDVLGSYYREFCGSGGERGVVPGSVKTVAAHPFKIPAHLGIKGHFASFPIEWPLWIVAGWSKPGATVLDPFGGTGAVALAAHVLGRQAISVDLSADCCRIAEWRTADPAQIARAQALADRHYRPGSTTPDADR
jgi:DNA modification methylase